jgi:hypothetical protein
MTDLQKLQRVCRVFLARLLMVYGPAAPDPLRRIADELEWLEAERVAQLASGERDPPNWVRTSRHRRVHFAGRTSCESPHRSVFDIIYAYRSRRWGLVARTAGETLDSAADPIATGAQLKRIGL